MKAQLIHGTSGRRRGRAKRFRTGSAAESAHPNDLWQADQHRLDVMVLDETGKPARPWLTVIRGDQSRAVAGYTVFLGDPTALRTALALRQATDGGPYRRAHILSVRAG